MQLQLCSELDLPGKRSRSVTKPFSALIKARAQQVSSLTSPETAKACTKRG